MSRAFKHTVRARAQQVRNLKAQAWAVNVMPLDHPDRRRRVREVRRLYAELPLWIRLLLRTIMPRYQRTRYRWLWQKTRPRHSGAGTSGGVELTERRIRQLADEAEQGYDLSRLRRRHTNRS